MQTHPMFVNISAYKFVTLDNVTQKRPVFLDQCQQLSLKGTILLSSEGINLFLAGTRQNIDAFLAWLRSDPRFSDLQVKESFSHTQPFHKMRVKQKREIITMKHPLVKPESGRAPMIDAATLKRWLDQGHDDEGNPVVMMDTRNDFEVDVGTFNNTLDYRITKFSEFPDVVAAHRDELEGTMQAKLVSDNVMQITLSVKVFDHFIPIVGVNLQRNPANFASNLAKN